MAIQIRLEGFIGWEVSNWALMRQLPKDKAAPVHVFVDSPGGDAFEGFAIFNTLSKRENVTVEIGARALSAASYIPFAASRVLVSKISTWMAHNAQTFTYGDKEEMRKTLALLEGVDGIMADIYRGEIGDLEREEILAKMGEEFWLFGGQSIIDAGIATEMSTKTPTEEEKTEEEGESETVDRSEVIENFRAIFSEKMSERPSQPSDLKLMNLIVEDFRKREETTVANGKKLAGQTTAPALTKAPQGGSTKGATLEALGALAPTNLGDEPHTIEQIDNSTVINEAVGEERTRILNLLGMTGVKITEAAKKAIENGVSKGEFAIAILEEQKSQAPQDNGDRIQAMPAKGMPQMAETVDSSQKTQRQKDADHGDVLANAWWPKAKE